MTLAALKWQQDKEMRNLWIVQVREGKWRPIRPRGGYAH